MKRQPRCDLGPADLVQLLYGNSGLSREDVLLLFNYPVLMTGKKGKPALQTGAVPGVIAKRSKSSDQKGEAGLVKMRKNKPIFRL